jgi:outer membrane receptor protein involved in Fe transport
VGLVFAGPDFLPGFSASIDYYRIKIRDVVSTLSAQQQVNFCFVGLQQFCSSFDLTPGSAFVNVQAFNLAEIYTNGIDIETSYQMSLERVHLPGSLTFRALATHVINNITDPGIIGAVPVQNAGVNIPVTNGSTPDWKAYLNQSWDFANMGIDLTERYVSDGVFGNQYIVCQSNCPVSTVNNPTINFNHMAGAFYLDLGARYSVSDNLAAFIKVDNMLDRDPVASPQTNTGIDINPFLYDTLGRTFRAGVRYNF